MRDISDDGNNSECDELFANKWVLKEFLLLLQLHELPYCCNLDAPAPFFLPSCSVPLCVRSACVPLMTPCTAYVAKSTSNLYGCPLRPRRRSSAVLQYTMYGETCMGTGSKSGGRCRRSESSWRWIERNSPHIQEVIGREGGNEYREGHTGERPWPWYDSAFMRLPIHCIM